MLPASSNAYPKTAAETALALLRGTGGAPAKTDTPDNNAKASDRGPAVQVNVSNKPRGVALLEATLNALQPALDDETASELFDKLQETTDALTKLDQARQGMVSDRKAAAEQKLELARKKLALLRALGGDPKTIARQARAIAQELKAAAIEYGEALKAQSGDGATASAADAALASTDPAIATGDKPPEAAAAATDAVKSEAAPEQAALPQSPADKAAADAKAAEQDREVLEAFKDAAREVKRLLQEAARKLKAQQAADADNSAQASASMDKAIEGLAEIMGISQSGSTDAASAITDILMMPTIDIRV